MLTLLVLFKKLCIQAVKSIAFSRLDDVLRHSSSA